MPHSETIGPIELTREAIFRNVMTNSMGNYALGFVLNGRFHMSKAINEDDELQDSLIECASNNPKGYTHFVFAYLILPKTPLEIVYDRLKGYEKFVD